MAREETMKEYDDKQDKERCLIFERLDDTRMRRIDPTLTAFQIMEKLDQEHATTSAIGIMVKRDRYYQFKYRPGGDFEKFIELHEARAKEFMEAGGVISEMESPTTSPSNSSRLR